jgi:hypothetical protein
MNTPMPMGTESGDECPNCKCGTLEQAGTELLCRGECGAIFSKPPGPGLQTFLDKLYELSEQGKHRRSAKLIFDFVEDMMEAQDWETTTTLLGKVDPELVTTHEVYALLCAMRPLRKTKIGWEPFVKNARLRFEAMRGPEVASKLMAGFEGD